MSNKTTTLRVSEERKLKLERDAIEISYKTGVPVKWTELANHLFDAWSSEAKKELINSRDIKAVLKK